MSHSMQPPYPPVRQKHRPSPLFSCPLILLISGVILANLFVFFLIGLSAHHSYHQYQERAEIATQNLAQVLESEIAGAIKADDMALSAMINEYIERRDGYINDDFLTARIDQIRSQLPEIDALRIADAQGRLIYGNDVTPGTRTSVADRPHFIRLHDDPKAGLVISKPQQSRINQKWVIVLARRIDRPDGSFGGMAFAAITLEHISRIFSAIDVGPHGVVVLRDGDLSVVSRHPELAEAGSMIGSTAMAPEFREMIRAQPFAGTTVARSQLDNVERTYSYRRIGAYPLYILIGQATEDYLSNWYTATAMQAALAVVFALITFVAAWLIYRTWKRQNSMVEELARQETKFRTVANYTIDWEYWLGPTGEILYMTPSCEHITGYSPVEFTANPGLLLSITHPEDRHLMKCHLSDITHQSSPQETQMDFRIVRRDGNIRWLAHHCHAIPGPDSACAGRRVSNRDITERKRMEQALQEQKNFLATILETEPECVKVVAADGTLLQMNHAGLSMLEANSVEEVNASGLINFVMPEHRAAFTDLFRQVFAGETRSLEFQVQGKLGRRRWLETHEAPLRDSTGKITHLLGVTRDITLRKMTEDETKHLAFYDPLTRLPNRRLLLDRLRLALVSSIRSKREGALLFIDLDNFKTLNDTLGHNVGDLLLQQVALRLATCVREGDTVARLGGDEFVIMLDNLSENHEEAATQTKAVAEKVLATLNQPYLLAGYERHSTPSIGATLFNGHKNSVDELLKRADLAMYQAKAAGRNTLRFFDPEMQAVVNARAMLEADLRMGLMRNQFLLYYQPHVDEEGRMTGAEALLRWQHPRRGLLTPADFIPLAEDTGLILPLGQWVLKTACAQLAAWSTQPKTANLTLAVNISPRQLRHPDFVIQVLAVLNQTGADPHKLKLELTESMLMDNVEDLIVKMTALKAEGVGFALDDFGTNYSSLTYLKRLPLDQLKIDRSIVRDILTDTGDATIARTIVTLAQSMGLNVIAEGVETREQREFLAQMSCHAFQGYFFGRPAPKEEFGLTHQTPKEPNGLPDKLSQQ
ncbi:Signal transduction protein [Georgfuchsia toluolica]|uniref:Signal transduction protein n=1 Tax=Georgfuchsia toluolica TaxID=424218 RepID=A0A916N1Z3_9PROT|nr:EAL domain-containing protein [Georgfuchsia toluolica]CAG4883239.1 Signal transduction protein [Georgfuchsia toluolica]